MPVSPEYRDWILEQLRYAGAITTRRMFGGMGLYRDGIFFALIADDVLYFKVDDSSRADYEAAGMEPFRPYGDARSMSYSAVPPEVLEDADALTRWADRAVEAARAARARKGRR